VLDQCLAAGREPEGIRGVVEHPRERRREGCRIVGRNEQSRLAVADDLGDAVDGARHHGRPGCERLHAHERETFDTEGAGDDGGAAKQGDRGRAIRGAEEADALGDPPGALQLLEGRTGRAITGQEQVMFGALEPRERLDEHVESFLRASRPTPST